MDERLGDLQAQLAANATGRRLLLDLVDRYGGDSVTAQMEHILSVSGEAMAEALGNIQDGDYHFMDTLDDGSPVSVTLFIMGEKGVIDFAGTGSQHPGNLNAPRAVVKAAVLYFLRTLIKRPIPLNDGCLAPIELRIPEVMECRYPVVVKEFSIFDPFPAEDNGSIWS